MTGPPRGWPVEFTATVRAAGQALSAHKLIEARDMADGVGSACCVVCGLPVRRVLQVPVHHRLYKSRGGRGNPGNGITVHDGCHEWIHGHGRAAAGQGWALPGSVRWDQAAGRAVRCARRGAIVLFDAPDQDGGWWRPAIDAEVGWLDDPLDGLAAVARG